MGRWTLGFFWHWETFPHQNCLICNCLWRVKMKRLIILACLQWARYDVFLCWKRWENNKERMDDISGSNCSIPSYLYTSGRLLTVPTWPCQNVLLYFAAQNHLTSSMWTRIGKSCLQMWRKLGLDIRSNPSNMATVPVYTDIHFSRAMSY